MSAWDQAMASAGRDAGEAGIEARETAPEAAEVARLVAALEEFTQTVQRLEALAALVGTPGERGSTREDVDVLAAGAKSQSLVVAGLFSAALKDARSGAPAARRVRSKLRRDFEKAKRHLAELLHDTAEKERATAPMLPYEDDVRGSRAADGPGSTGGLQTPLLQAYHSEADVEAIIAQERGAEIERLATSVQEIHQIYAELGEIVEEQTVGLDDIESHVSSARDRVEAGFRQVESASRLQSGGNKVCVYSSCLLIIAAIIAVMVLFGNRIFH